MTSIPLWAGIPGTGAIPACETAVEWLDPDGVAVATRVGVSRFAGADGVEEWHLTVAPEGGAADLAAEIEGAWLAALESVGLAPTSTVMRRVFSGDATRHGPLLERFAAGYPGAFSVIGQAPLGAGGLALWSQHIVDPKGPLVGSGGASSFRCKRGPLTHHWISGLCDHTNRDSHSQSAAVLARHNEWLANHGMTLADNVMRTWWFVRDIDNDYQGLVDARREVFARHGLTKHTHYIASTGIAGSHPDPAALLSLDSYSIAGIEPRQIEYPVAPDHLGPTHDYGVTFERATAISYADRKHVLISGTASIDPTGNIVHPGDVLLQLDRTIENISALLAAAGASSDDLAMILVYLRKPGDAVIVEKAMRGRFEDLPMVFLHAPVCRPGWLVEIEGVAIVAARNPELPGF